MPMTATPESTPAPAPAAHEAKPAAAPRPVRQARPASTRPASARPADIGPAPPAAELFADPDLVDRVFDYVVQLLPEIRHQAAEVKTALRDEFGGQEAYIRKPKAPPRVLAVQVLSLFNGRNATEVARVLKISRASVYRFIKQSGPVKPGR